MQSIFVGSEKARLNAEAKHKTQPKRVRLIPLSLDEACSHNPLRNTRICKQEKAVAPHANKPAKQVAEMLKH